MAFVIKTHKGRTGEPYFTIVKREWYSFLFGGIDSGLGKITNKGSAVSLKNLLNKKSLYHHYLGLLIEISQLRRERRTIRNSGGSELSSDILRQILTMDNPKLIHKFVKKKLGDN